MWTRVAFLNMSDTNQVCPNNWTTISSPVKACGRGRITPSGCNSVFYSTFGQTYSHVCGRMIAYQDSSTNAFFNLHAQNVQIDGPYLDGVSLTHGSEGSRQHIWSFASAIGQGVNTLSSQCACSNSDPWPYNISFVGNDYFCDSGNHGSGWSSIIYSSDPLWDGQGCDPFISTCCQFNSPPWFCKTLSQSTIDDLEVRICHSGDNEDTLIQLIELYVQ